MDRSGWPPPTQGSRTGRSSPSGCRSRGAGRRRRSRLPALRVDLFDYDLPEPAIAQEPLADRGASRLLVLGRESGNIVHARFEEIERHLPAGALLILNDSAVIPARILGKKRGSGGKVEIFLLEEAGGDRSVWRALVTASKPVKKGTVVELAAEATAEVIEAHGEGEFTVRIKAGGMAGEEPERLLARIGRPPLPPYIRREADEKDRVRYQTVYARKAGAVAAPTAGLHFSREKLDSLRRVGFSIAPVTLHVGRGTFLPVRVDEVEKHVMHSERFEVPEATAVAVQQARGEGRKVVAVGTTSLRTLEASEGKAGSGSTDLFIKPGYRFQVVDALLTNFHQPRSTLLMLVSAFAGRERILAAYREALANGYRFLSYGDAMLIV